MKTLHYSIIVISFALVLILPSTVFATMLYNNDEVLKQFNANSTKMSKLVHDDAILITTQTIKKTEYKLGEKIIVHPTLTNIGNKNMNIFYMWHPFFFVINDQNGFAVWANGPSVPMMEYSSNLNQTIEPNMSFTGGIHDVADPRHPVILNNPGNYTISSVADFYGYGTPRNLVWSEPIKFTVLPETYSVADMNMLPPLQQFLAGIPATSVKCGDGLELLIKTNTGLPICAKHHTVTKLIERGWAKKAPSQIPVVIMPPGFDDIHSGKTYDPSSINVVIGINNTVRWTNKASTSDTLTSDGFKESNSFGEIFGGSTISPGDTYEFTFTKSGTFGYHGVPHSWNKGKIIVLPPNDNTDISGTKSNNLKSDIISDHVVTVVSIKSVPPVTPGGPTIQLTLKNNNAHSITSLNATLELYNSYVFDFKDVTQSQPLTSGNSISETKILIGGGFTTDTQYPLIITGMANGMPFSYTENVTIVP